MPEHDRPAAPPHGGYETRDANARAVWAIGVGVVVSLGLIQLAVWGLFDFFKRREPGPSDAWNPMAARLSPEPLNERLDSVPPPRLEGLQRLEAEVPGVRSSLPTPEGNSPEFHPGDVSPSEQPALNGYSWVDKEKGIARIPIEQAMRLALHNGALKSAPGAAELPAVLGGLGRPSESNSGRGAGPGKSR